MSVRGPPLSQPSEAMRAAATLNDHSSQGYFVQQICIDSCRQHRSKESLAVIFTGVEAEAGRGRQGQTM